MANFTEKVSPVSFAGEKTIKIDGQEIPYHFLAEDMIIPAEDGTEAFDFFCFSYFRSDVSGEEKNNRPVIFAFNGGPTSSSTWMHLGFWGPRILVPGEDGLPDQVNPGSLRDNPDSLLDLADIVMIDPVNTGFSRLLEAEYACQCYGDHEDADSVSRFVLAWLKKHERTCSPVYLSGESFGSTRASLMSWYLKNQVNLKGIIHIGPGYSNSQATIRTYKDMIPAAALHWYFMDKAAPAAEPGDAAEAKPGDASAAEPGDVPETEPDDTSAIEKGRQNSGSKPSLNDWIRDARKFFYHEYIPAYHLGSMLGSEGKKQTAEKLAYFTGLSADYYMDHNLIVDRRDFRMMLLADQGLKLGSYDGRFTLPVEAEGDAFTAAFDPGMKAGMKKYLKELGIDLARRYRGGSYEDDPEWDWNYNASPDMIGFMAFKMPMDQAVSIAMKEKTDMRLFFGTGFYDTVATVENTRYSITHTDVPIDRVIMKEYESGHAVYADDASRHRLAADIRAFLTERQE